MESRLSSGESTISGSSHCASFALGPLRSRCVASIPESIAMGSAPTTPPTSDSESKKLAPYEDSKWGGGLNAGRDRKGPRAVAAPNVGEEGNGARTRGQSWAVVMSERTGPREWSEVCVSFSVDSPSRSGAEAGRDGIRGRGGAGGRSALGMRGFTAARRLGGAGAMVRNPDGGGGAAEGRGASDRAGSDCIPGGTDERRAALGRGGAEERGRDPEAGGEKPGGGAEDAGRGAVASVDKRTPDLGASESGFTHFRADSIRESSPRKRAARAGGALEGSVTLRSQLDPVACLVVQPFSLRSACGEISGEAEVASLIPWVRGSQSSA